MQMYSGYFSRGAYFANLAQRAHFTNFEISKLNYTLKWVCSIRVQLALKKASLSRPRHVPSSFVASVNKEVRHVIAQCT